MKKIENKIMLITYPDSLGKDIPALNRCLNKYFKDLFGGIHILPFYPSSGDRGFAVIDYDNVCSDFGCWKDIDDLAEQYYLLADFMINHVSVRSREFRDYMEKGEQSAYRGMFIHWDEFWPAGRPTKDDIEALYRRRAEAPCRTFVRKDGRKVMLWNTFFEEQVDVDPFSESTKAYYQRNLEHLASHVPFIRFDAFAYTSKRPGSNCFFVQPEIWDILKIGTAPLEKTGTEVLLEIHASYKIQLEIAQKGYWVYDFALPMLILHAVFSGNAEHLAHWLKVCPRKQFTTLDTHDGIGVVDVAGLLREDEIEFVRKKVEKFTADARPFIRVPGGMVKSKGKKLRQYQIPSTYYSALNCDDNAYLLARAVQFFTPGIPQVYYVGLLAGKNDIEALKRGEEGRSINRHNYTEQEIEENLSRPVVRKLFELMRFRNEYPAFEGEVFLETWEDKSKLTVTWKKDNWMAALHTDFSDRSFEITYRDQKTGTMRYLVL